MPVTRRGNEPREILAPIVKCRRIVGRGGGGRGIGSHFCNLKVTASCLECELTYCNRHIQDHDGCYLELAYKTPFAKPLTVK